MTEVTEYRERKIVMADGPLEGTPDLVRIYHKQKVISVTDYKFGFIAVEPAHMSLQMRAYAVMAVDSYLVDWNKVFVTIIQPRAPFHQRITIAQYLEADIDAAREEIHAITAAAQQPDAPLHAGDWCRYCRARAICPELADAVGKGLVPFEGLPKEFSKTARLGRVEARLAKVSDDQLGKMLEAYSLINFIYDPLMDEARRRIENGLLLDWKLGKVVERRKITDSAKAISLLALAGMHRDEIMACANLSLTKLEEKLNGGELRFGMVKNAKDARDFTNQVLESVLEIETGRPRVLKK